MDRLDVDHRIKVKGVSFRGQYDIEDPDSGSMSDFVICQHAPVHAFE